MQIENRSGFFPRQYRLQPARYERVHDAWGAVFVAPNGNEYIIVLHIRTESPHKALIRGMQRGQLPHHITPSKVVDGFQVFLMHRGHFSRALTPIIHSLDQAVRFLEGMFKSLSTRQGS